MAAYKFTLRTDLLELNNKVIGKFDAFIPDTDMSGATIAKAEIPKFINIEGAIFKTVSNGGNQSVFIASGTLADSPKQNPRTITYTAATETQFFWYRINHDKSQQWAFIGLVLALIGTTIDAAYAAGKSHAYIKLPYQINVTISGLSFALKVIGLGLAFKKGVWDAR